LLKDVEICIVLVLVKLDTLTSEFCTNSRNTLHFHSGVTGLNKLYCALPFDIFSLMPEKFFVITRASED